MGITSCRLLLFTKGRVYTPSPVQQRRLTIRNILPANPDGHNVLLISSLSRGVHLRKTKSSLKSTVCMELISIAPSKYSSGLGFISTIDTCCKAKLSLPRAQPQHTHGPAFWRLPEDHPGSLLLSPRGPERRMGGIKPRFGKAIHVSSVHRFRAGLKNLGSNPRDLVKWWLMGLMPT